MPKEPTSRMRWWWWMMAAAMAHHTRPLSMCVSMALTLYECSGCPAIMGRYTTLQLAEPHQEVLDGMHDQHMMIRTVAVLGK